MAYAGTDVSLGIYTILHVIRGSCCVRLINVDYQTLQSSRLNPAAIVLYAHGALWSSISLDCPHVSHMTGAHWTPI